MDANEFGRLLRELRAEAGLTQEALAKAAGLGWSTVRQYEYGMREPVYSQLVKLAAALGAGLGDFEPSKASKAKPRKGK